jgi:parallel beta-helix repeat protein
MFAEGVKIYGNTIDGVRCSNVGLSDGIGIDLDYAFATVGYETDNAEVYQNVISGASLTVANIGVGIWAARCVDCDIYSNLIRDCDYGVITGAGSGNDLYDNTIADIAYDGHYAQAGGQSLANNKNNVFYNCAGEGIDEDTGNNPTPTNCGFYSNGTNYSGLGGCTDCVTTNPYFTDASNNDFTLQPSSPYIDAGTDTGVTEDGEGDTKPQDGDGDGTDTHDMGWDEFDETNAPMHTFDTAGWSLANRVVDCAGANRVGVMVISGGTSGTVKQSTITDCHTGINARINCSSTNNIIWNNDDDEAGAGTITDTDSVVEDDSDTDPLFWGADNDDYRLKRSTGYKRTCDAVTGSTSDALGQQYPMGKKVVPGAYGQKNYLLIDGLR